ncbi:MAG: TIR domain-containing protein [Chloroflexota bacterium]
MSRVFISYNREDSLFAQRLRDHVQGLGFETWLDVDDIPKGVYWPDAVDEGLRASDVVVGVMTPESVASRNVKNEWDWALDNDKPLLLLRLRQAPVPHRYISLNYIECAHDEAAGFAQLGTALANPNRARYRDETAPPAPRETNRTYSSSDGRNRARMLEKVQGFWIKGVLEHSLHGAALIALGMEGRDEAVEHPWDMVLRHPQYENTALPSETRITDVFDDLGGELLILGAPGSGKTTMLLELARDLIARALTPPSVSHQDEPPIPVIFNLSSWADDRKTIAEWLVDELNTRYQVPRNMGKAWVDADAVLPLFDGLDEVTENHRAGCVEAINHFRSEHGFLPLAVCSRSADYDALSAKLQLQGAVVLQPLTSEQIDGYLAGLGDALEPARKTLHSDPALLELAQTPLMLSILALAYRGVSAEALAAATTPDERRKRLFEAYTDSMLSRRGDAPYTAAQTKHWLSNLARGMAAHGHTIFFIEGLQPDWLPKNWRWLYTLSVRTAVGLILGMSFGLAGGLGAALPIGLSGAIAAGFGRGAGAALGFLILGVSIGLFGGLGGGFIMGVLRLIYRWIRPAKIERAPSADTERERWAKGDSIGVVETLSWSSGKAAKGLLVGLAGGLLSGFIGAVAGGLAQTPVTQAAIVMAVGLGVGLGGGLLGGLVGREIGMRTQPNQGIWRSGRNAVRVGLVGAFAGALVLGIVFGLAGALSAEPNLRLITGVGVGSGIGAAFGIAFGIAGGMFFGGLACVQHVLLRIVLTLSRQMPWNISRFLDHAVERIFLRKVGGGYIFVHRLLLEYFAGLAD